MHPLARVCSNGMPSVFCRRRAWRAWRGGRKVWGTRYSRRARGTTHITAQVSLAWFPRPSAGAVPDGWLAGAGA